MKKNMILIPILCLLFGVSCTKSEKAEVGTKDNPLKLMFVPTDDTEKITLSAKELDKFLETFISQKLYSKDTGFYVKSSVPSSYIAVVESFGSKRADFAHIDTFSYVLLKDIKKYNGDAILTIVRGDNETSYKGQIIVKTDSKIKNLSDLSGKKFAYTDPASPAGFILPSKLIASKNVKLGQVVYAGRHDNVVTMVYQGQVDAGATYFSPKVNGEDRDARVRVLTQFPDVLKKVKVLEFTDDIPNAPWVLRSDIYDTKEKNDKLKSIIQEAMLSYAGSKEGKENLMKMYAISGLVKSTDDDFKKARELFSDYLSGLDKEKK